MGLLWELQAPSNGLLDRCMYWNKGYVLDGIGVRLKNDLTDRGVPIVFIAVISGLTYKRDERANTAFIESLFCLVRMPF